MDRGWRINVRRTSEMTPRRWWTRALATLAVVTAVFLVLFGPGAGGSQRTALADGTAVWTGNGTTNGSINTIDCSSAQPGTIHWVLSSAGPTATSADIT